MFSLNQNDGGNSFSGGVPKEYEAPKYSETGEVTLDGHKYVISPNGATIDGVPINNLKLVISNGKLYINQGNGYYKAFETDSIKKILEDTFQKKDALPTVPPEIVQQPVIEQISQIVPQDRPIDVSHLISLKFEDKKTLFEQPATLVMLALAGVWIFKKLSK
jgi:hypothetical protein